MSPVAVELSYLNRSRANRRLASALGANALIAARLVNEDELVRSKLRDLVEVVALKICVLFLCDLLSGLL
jgi:hypothetical protein